METGGVDQIQLVSIFYKEPKISTDELREYLEVTKLPGRFRFPQGSFSPEPGGPFPGLIRAARVPHGVLPAEGVAGAKGVEEVHREPLLNLLVRVEQPIPPAGKLSSKFYSIGGELH